MLFVHYRETRSNISVTELFCMVYKSFFDGFVSSKDHSFFGTQKHLENVPVGFGELENTEKDIYKQISKC